MTREETLEKAKTCVCGDRHESYGTAEQNFGRIAELWTAYWGRDEVVFTKADVAAMMALMKIARIAAYERYEASKYNDDNWVDLAGYAACGAEAQESHPTINDL